MIFDTEICKTFAFLAHKAEGCHTWASVVDCIRLRNFDQILFVHLPHLSRPCGMLVMKGLLCQFLYTIQLWIWEWKKTAQFTVWCCLCSSNSHCSLRKQYDPGYESAQGRLNNSTKQKLQTDLEFFSLHFSLFLVSCVISKCSVLLTGTYFQIITSAKF